MKNNFQVVPLVLTTIVGLLMFSLLGISDAQAQSYAQGVASIEMKKKCRDDKPRKREDYDTALSSAKVNAIRSWTARKSAAFAELYQNSEQEIIEQINNYLLNPVIMSKCDKKTFTVSVRAEINESALGQLMARNKPQNSVRSRMTAVFIARKQASVKGYDAKVTNIQETQEFSEAEQSADVSGSGMAASGYSSTRTVDTTGGSTERKSDKIAWDVFQADGLDAAVNETFASFGFRVIDSSQVAGRFPGFDVNQFREEFGVGEDLTPETKNAAFNAIAGKIPLLVIATVDVLASSVDDDGSGEISVTVSVKAQVYQDDGLFYETVASVAPTQRMAKGKSESSAQTDALIMAAKTASTEIINQLNSQGIK
jgi:hypothetical protein